MTVKSTIEVDLKGGEAFSDYVKKVQQLNDIIGELPGEWGKVAKAMSLAVGAEASKAVGQFDAKLEDLRNQMVSLSQTTIGFSNSFRNAEVSAGNIFAAMRGTVGAVASLAKFGLGFAGGLASSVLGWSQWGLMGMLGIGRNVVNDQSRAYATNTSMGFQQAFFKNPGSIGQTMPGAQGFFGSVMEAEEGFSPMWAQLGVRRTGNTEADFQTALIAAQRRLKAIPQNMVGMRYQLLGIPGLSLEGANFLRRMSTQDLQHMLASSSGAAAASNRAVTDEDAIRWRHFVQEVENDFLALSNILKRQLIPLQEPIQQLFHGFTDFATQLGESGLVKRAISAFASWLSHDAMSDLSWFGHEVLALANSIGDIPGQFHKLHEMFDAFFNLPVVKWIYEHSAITQSLDPQNYKGSTVKGGVDLNAIINSETGSKLIGDIQGAYNAIPGLPNKVLETIAGAESSFGKKMSGTLGAFGLTGGWRKSFTHSGDTDAITSARGFKQLYEHYHGNTAQAIAAYTMGSKYVDDAIAKAGGWGDWRGQLENEPNYGNVARNKIYATAVGVPYQQNITVVVPGVPGGSPTVTGAGAAASGSAGQGRGW